MSYNEMFRQFTILRPAHPEVFAHWRELDSWAARQILDKETHGIAKRPPKFRSWRYSFTLSHGFYGDKVRIQDKYYLPSYTR